MLFRYFIIIITSILHLKACLTSLWSQLIAEEQLVSFNSFIICFKYNNYLRGLTVYPQHLHIVVPSQNRNKHINKRAILGTVCLCVLIFCFFPLSFPEGQFGQLWFSFYLFCAFFTQTDCDSVSPSLGISQHIICFPAWHILLVVLT